MIDGVVGLEAVLGGVHLPAQPALVAPLAPEVVVLDVIPHPTAPLDRSAPGIYILEENKVIKYLPLVSKSCKGSTASTKKISSVMTSVSDPDPVGSVSFARIRIRIHFRKC